MPAPSPAFAGPIPENYDRYLGPYIFEPYARNLVAGTASMAPRTILETACGTGRVTRHLLKTFPGAKLTATDVNGDMINIARQYVSDTHIEWRVADAQELPFNEDSFDLVISQFGLMFVPDKPKALAEARRVLKPGGRLLFSTWDRLENNPSFHLADKVVAKYFPVDPPRFFHIPFSLYDDTQLAAWVKDAGFKDVHISLVRLTCESASAADTARGMLEGSPMYTALNELAPGLLPVIKEELSKALAGEFGDAPMISPMQAWVVQAE
jgi:ubiquinone/menaquinone biosynthesis C-methylase UbiE